MKAIYPGSFDPVTLGHLDIIKRSAKKFDELIIGVLRNNSKNTMFTLDERVEMIEQVLYDCDNIKVEVFDGLLVDFFDEVDADIVVRGLRAVSDYEYELQMAQVNKQLNSNVETLFLVASSEYSYISSSLVKEISYYGGDISLFVPKYVEDKIKEKIGRK